MDRMTWNEFRKHHKGKGKEEVSQLWSEYKRTAEESLSVEEEFTAINKVAEMVDEEDPELFEPHAQMTPQINITVEEISIEEAGKMLGDEVMGQITEAFPEAFPDNIDPNHGYDLDHIAAVEAEMALDNVSEPPHCSNCGEELDWLPIPSVEQGDFFCRNCDENHPEHLPDESHDGQHTTEIARDEEDQQFLDGLNHPETRIGLKLITHW